MINIFPPKTVAGALSPLTTISKNLQAVINRQERIIDTSNAAMDRLKTDMKVAAEERNNAVKVLNALAAVLDPKE